jgi:chromosome segregation ATPase
MWDKFKSALFEEDPNAAKPAAPAAAPVQAAPIGQVPGLPQAENTFVAALRQAIKQRSSAFTNLLAAADKLANIIPDPATRLRAAFATSGDGRSPREVVDAITVHISDLEGQKLQFQRALEGQRAAKLGGLQAELDALRPANDNAAAQIASMTQSIQQLQQLIATNTSRGNELQGQLATETASFTASAQQFELALATVKQELEGQKTAVLSTLS